MKMKKIITYLNLLIILTVVLVFNNCASYDKKELVLATVNGEPITEGDLIYSLTISHRREDLSSAGSLNLSQYINKMIDDRIIIHDARYAGIDKMPEVISALNNFILRESVMKLREEEVLNKIVITDEEINEVYKKDYERFKFKVIELNSEDIANEVMLNLKNGAKFEDMINKYSMRSSKEQNNETVQTRNTIPPEIYNAMSEIKPGEYTKPVKVSDKYYILLFLSKEEASKDEFDNLKETVKNRLRKQKEKEKGDECLEKLRAKVKIFINKELLSDENKEIIDGIVAEVDGEKLTMSDFKALKDQRLRLSAENIVKEWIDRKVIDHEALSRNYQNLPEIKDKIKRYQDQLLKNIYIENLVKTVIIPRINIDEEILKNYYSEHKKDFMKPLRYKMQVITVETEKEANEILENLKNGADFSWLAKRKSKDNLSQKSGEMGWVTAKELPEQLRQNLGKLKPGDFSDILKFDESEYAIYMLKEVSKEEYEEFENVKDLIFKAYFNEKVKEILNNVINNLKKDAEIKIYDENIKFLEDKFGRQMK